MKKILLVGATGAGKTTLRQRLTESAITRKKTQMIEWKDCFIDCPGEYLEIPRYYHVLIDMSFRASEVWALIAADCRQNVFPPQFARSFKCPVIGIISKTDSPEKNMDKARQYLSFAGITGNIYEVCAITGDNCTMLRERMTGKRLKE